jgi:ribonuclease J
MLGENGIVIISCTLDKETKEILGGPEILTRGFIYVKESQDLLEETKRISKEVIEESISENDHRVDYSKIKNDVRDVLGKECKIAWTKVLLKRMIRRVIWPQGLNSLRPFYNLVRPSQLEQYNFYVHFFPL